MYIISFLPTIIPRIIFLIYWGIPDKNLIFLKKTDKSLTLAIKFFNSSHLGCQRNHQLVIIIEVSDVHLKSLPPQISTVNGWCS